MVARNLDKFLPSPASILSVTRLYAKLGGFLPDLPLIRVNMIDELREEMLEEGD